MIGAGPLFGIILLAELGLWPDPNPGDSRLAIGLFQVCANNEFEKVVLGECRKLKLSSLNTCNVASENPSAENGENLVSVHGMNYRLGLGCVTMSPRERNPIPNSLQTDTCRSKRFFVRIIPCRVRSGTRPQAGK